MEIEDKILRYVSKKDIDENGRFVCPDGVEIISKAFTNVSGIIRHISLPNSVKKIEENAFSDCCNIVSLNIPEGIESVDIDYFSVSYEKKDRIVYWKGAYANDWQNLDLPKGIKIKRFINKDLPEGLLVVNVENLERIIKENRYVKDKPVIINIKNVSELPLEKLREFSEKCRIQAIQIMDINSQERNNETRCPYDVETYKKCREAIDDILNKIDAEKYKKEPDGEKIIFGKVIRELANITYDKEAYRKGVRFVSCRNLEGGLLTGTCVCVGYSEIIRNILACYGIEAKLIAGGAHCWNQVKLDGDWYNVDLTFDQARILKGKKPKYMLKSDKDFKGHSKMLLDFKKKREDIQGSYIPDEFKKFDTEICEKTVPQNEILRYIYGDNTVKKEKNVPTTEYYVPQQTLHQNADMHNQILNYIKKEHTRLSEIISMGKSFLEDRISKRKDKERGEKDE